MHFSKTAILDAITGLLASQRANLILWIPVFMGVGAALYYGLPTEPSFIWSLPVFILSAASMGSVAYACYRADDLNRFYVPLILVSMVFWSVAGFVIAQNHTRSVHTPMLASESRLGQVTGKIVHQEILEGRKGSLVILDNVAVDKWKKDATPRKVRLTIRKIEAPIMLGDTISVLAKLHPASAPVTPGAYDFLRFYYFQGIGALGFAVKAPVVIEKAAEDDYTLLLERLRRNIGSKVHEVLEPRVAGIAVALMTGERAAIEADDWDALRASGLAHIISISGLHVVLVATPVFFVVRLFLAAFPFVALRWPIKKIAACAALIACASYVALVVPCVPSYRALLMTGIGLIAIMLDRSPFSMRLVAFAAAVVLLFSPDSVWSISFQMSFAAVAALVAVADVLRPYWSAYIRNGGWVRKALVYTVGIILTSTVASIATAPFSSFHFQQIASYSVLANALATPLTGLIIMPMMILSFLLMPFGLAGETLAFMGQGITWMLDIAKAVADMPGSVIQTPAWPMAALLCFVTGGLLLILLLGRARWVSVPLFVTGFVIILMAREPAIMINATGKLVMVNGGPDKAVVSTRRKEKFVLETWQKRVDLGAEQVVAWPKEGSADAGSARVTCDTQVCRIELPGLKISTGQSLYDLQLDCEWADIIIVPDKKMRQCPDREAQIYDRWRLMKTGALSIMPDGAIKTVRDQQGDRPWSTWLKDKPKSMIATDEGR